MSYDHFDIVAKQIVKLNLDNTLDISGIITKFYSKNLMNALIFKRIKTTSAIFCYLFKEYTYGTIGNKHRREAAKKILKQKVTDTNLQQEVQKLRRLDDVFNSL